MTPRVFVLEMVLPYERYLWRELWFASAENALAYARSNESDEYYRNHLEVVEMKAFSADNSITA